MLQIQQTITIISYNYVICGDVARLPLKKGKILRLAVVRERLYLQGFCLKKSKI